MLRQGWTWSMVTLVAAALVGCASSDGGEQNYRELERDAEPMQTDPDRAFPGGAAEGAEVELTPVRAVIQIERTNWEKSVVMPASGKTYHGPVYYTVPGEVEQVDVMAYVAVEERLQGAMDGADAENYSRNNLGHLGLEPIVMGIDTVLLPVRMVIEPPFKLVTTPE